MNNMGNVENTQEQENKAIIRLLYEAVLNQGKLAVIDEIFAPYFIDHSTPDQGDGPAGVRDYFTQVRAGFPDITVTIEALVAEDHQIAVRTTWRGTHQGNYDGVAPTGRQVTRTMLQIFRIENGKIVEEWNEGKGLLA